MAAITVACIKYIPTELPSQDTDRFVNSEFAQNNSHRHSLYIWNNSSSSSINIIIIIIVINP
ncbi:hypothetical protein Hanom_Chr05g00402551 [Helianthus anomalus]